jgi:predicted RNA-binding protein YlxR (DUF448 family)
METQVQPRPPQRSCIACRATSGKRELIRVVRSPGGAIAVDLTGKKPGRGAYVCPRYSCWEQALKKGRIEAALKAKLTPDDRLALNEFATSLRDAVAV